MDIFEKWLKGLKFIELFAGIGGFRVSLDFIGCECVWACEKDKNARLTYKANFGAMPYHDVRLDDLSNIPTFDILTAGFPCQDFSGLGEQKGLEGMKGTLFYEIIRYLNYFKPKYFILENVKGLLSSNDGKNLRIVLDELKSCEYYVHYEVVNSNLVLPQYRNRVYFFGCKDNVFANSKSILPDSNAIKSLKISDLLETNSSEPFLEYYKISVPKWKNVKRSKQVKKLGRDALLKRLICVDDEEINTLISNYRTSLKNVAQFVVDKSREEAEKVLDSNIRKESSTSFRPRWLTPREMARFMGFPADFMLHPNEVINSVQLGNAVTPPIIVLLTLSFLGRACGNISDNAKLSEYCLIKTSTMLDKILV